MSCIFAYSGNNYCKEALVDGLCSLSARGNDGAGISLKINDEILSVKTRGINASYKLNVNDFTGDSTIGLAAAGIAERNSLTDTTVKPAANNLFAVCCDGIISNFESLKKWCADPFPVLTNDDLLLALLCVCSYNSKIDAIKKIDEVIEGNPTYAFMPNDEDAIYCKMGEAPLTVGFSNDGIYLSSELNALINRTQKYIALSDGESARITKGKVTVFDKKYRKIKKTAVAIPNQKYYENNCILSDEIFYCPCAVKQNISEFTNGIGFNFGPLKFNKRSAQRIEKIIITASHSSFTAAKTGKYHFMSFTDIPCCVINSNELRYGFEVIDKSTLFIAISQRGEDTDTVQCAKKAVKDGAKTIAVCADKTSYLSRICEYTLAPIYDYKSSSTSCRAYLTQYLTLAFLALYLGCKTSIVSELYLNVTFKMAEMLPSKISSAVKSSTYTEKIAEDLLNSEYIFCTGMGIDSALAEEAALKLSQIAEINAHSCLSSEIYDMIKPYIKTRPSVIAFVTTPDNLERALYPLRTIKSSGAEVIIITSSNIEESIVGFNNIISFGDSVPLFNPLPCMAGFYKIAITANEIKKRKNTN